MVDNPRLNLSPRVKITFVMIDGLGDYNHRDIDCNLSNY